jgi:hypothetical protein
MALTLSKSNCSGVSPPDSESAAGRNIDEALWTAYHRYDKSAVTENYFAVYLSKILLQRIDLRT